MINLKKLTAAFLSVAAIAGNVITQSGDNYFELKSNATTASNTLNSVYNSWSSKISKEKNKFQNGKYWNGGNVDGYTSSKCTNHGSDSSLWSCNIITRTNIFDKDYKVIDERDKYNNPMPYAQCIGFSYKLASDIFDTDTFIRYKVKNQKIVYSTGSSQYTPRKGDNVRLFDEDYGHSIFITDVNTSTGAVTFAQCNNDGHCGIEWNAKKVKRGSDVCDVTVDFLRNYTVYVERPAIAGDLNLDGVISSADSAVFENTICVDGTYLNNAPIDAYDVDCSKYVDLADLNKIKYGSVNINTQPIIKASSATIGSRWVSCSNSGAFRSSDGNYYKKNSSGISFLGTSDTARTTVSVPSSAYCPTDGKTYSVTEIGAVPGSGPNNAPMRHIVNITIPDSVKVINKFAFYDSALKSLNFASMNSRLTTIKQQAFHNSALTSVELSDNIRLTTIEKGAFENSTAVTSVYLPYNLETIGADAFRNCTKLSTVMVENNSSSKCSVKTIGDCAFYGCKNLYITIPNTYYDLQLGTSAGIFEPSGSYTVSLNLYNSTSAYRVVRMRTKDITKWQNNKLLVYAGKIKFYNASGTNFKTRSQTSTARIYL